MSGKKAKKERKEAYKNSKTTSHWANKCEIKRYPWGFGPRYESRGFNTIKPLLINNNILLNNYNMVLIFLRRNKSSVSLVRMYVGLPGRINNILYSL